MKLPVLPHTDRYGPAAESRTLLLNENCFTGSHANRSVHRRDMFGDSTRTRTPDLMGRNHSLFSTEL